MPKKSKPTATEEVTDVVSSKRVGASSVYYEKSITKNLGNYESAKITIGVTLPLNPTDEELKVVAKTFEKADEVVTHELEVQLEDLMEDK